MPHRWLRLSLFSWIVGVIVLSALIGMNAVPSAWHVDPATTLYTRTYGWPATFRNEYKSIRSSEVVSPAFSSEEPMRYYAAFIADVVFALGVTVAATVLCERHLRRTAKADETAA